jgi:hypothetical protein
MKVGKEKKKKGESLYILGYLLELVTKIWQFRKKNSFEIRQIWFHFFP